MLLIQIKRIGKGRNLNEEQLNHRIGMALRVCWRIFIKNRVGCNAIKWMVFVGKKIRKKRQTHSNCLSDSKILKKDKLKGFDLGGDDYNYQTF